jgi:hypothetical protein
MDAETRRPWTPDRSVQPHLVQSITIRPRPPGAGKLRTECLTALEPYYGAVY